MRKTRKARRTPPIKKHKKKIRKIYLINIKTKEYKQFSGSRQLSDYLNAPIPRLYVRMVSKLIFDDVYIISQTLDYNIDEYHHIHKHRQYGAVNVYGQQLNEYIEQQQFYAKIQRSIPFFNSYTGMNLQSKPNYALTEEEAQEQGLESVFGGIIYIDKTKHLYIKDNGKYYQLVHPDYLRILNVF